MSRALLTLFVVLPFACSKAEEPLAASQADAQGDAGPRVDATSTDSTTAADTAPVPDTGAAVDTTVDEDTGTGELEVGPPPAPNDCMVDDPGPSSVGFVSLFYERLVKDCTSSACSDFYKLDSACLFTLQVADVEHETTLNPEHCAKMKKWLTSDVLVKHLRDTVTCYGSKDGIYESTQLTLSDGSTSKKTYMCPLEPFVSHRRCLDQLRSIYFPSL